MTKTKIRLSLVMLSFLTVICFFLGFVGLNYGNSAFAAVSVAEGSGATLKTDADSTIRFNFELNKDAVNEVITGADKTASMLFIPTKILEKQGGELTIDTQNIAKVDFVDGSANVDWSEVDDNYRFVATLSGIPKNRYDIEITAVMYLTDGTNTVYSDVMARSAQEVAREAYDKAEEFDKEDIEKYLLHYENSQSTTGSKYSAKFMPVEGNEPLAEKSDLLYGDEIVEEGLESYGWIDESDNYYNSLSEIRFAQQDNVYTAVNKLDEIMYSTKDNKAVIPEKFGTVTQLVATSNKAVYYDGTNYDNSKIPQYTSNATGTEIKTAKENGTLDKILPTYTVLVYGESNKLLGASTMKSYTKVLTSKADFEDSFSVSSNDAENPANDDYGYYIVANDITFEGDAYSVYSSTTKYNTFFGYFDGNGKTLELILGKYGLFGELKNAVVANTSMIVISDKGNGIANNVNYITVLGGYTSKKTETVHIENVYLRYDVEIKGASSTHTTTKSEYGFFAREAKDITYKNVIVDATKVDMTIGVFGTNANWAAPLSGGSGTYEVTADGVYMIQTSPYVEYFSTKSKVLRVVFAENDTTAMQTFITDHGTDDTGNGSKTLAELTFQEEGIYRYNDYSALVADKGEGAKYFMVGDMCVTKDGVIFGEYVEKLEGEIMYSTKDNEVVMPAILKDVPVTKVVSVDDGVVLYDGSTWSNVPEYTSTATGAEIKTAKDNGTLDTIVPTYSVYVYGEGDVLIGQITMKSYTKVLTEYQDFVDAFGAPYDTDGTTLLNEDSAYDDYGYYIVANDITFDKAYGNRTKDGKANTFFGYFDGNGKTLKLVLGSIGLFGELQDAVVANTSMIVISNKGNGVANNASYITVLGGYTDGQTKNVLVENVYLRYDVDITAGSYNNSNTKSEYGFFAKQATNLTYKNVIVDATRVTTTIGANLANRAAPLGGGSGTYSVKSAEGVYMIQTSPYVEYFSTTSKVVRVVFAENDTTAMDEFKENNSSLVSVTSQQNGVYRYDSLEALAGAVSATGKIGNFEVTAGGVNWVGSGN